jgi:hypothetical protein
MRLLTAALAAMAIIAVPALAVTAYNHTDHALRYNGDYVVEGHGHLIGSARDASIRSAWQQAGLPH